MNATLRHWVRGTPLIGACAADWLARLRARRFPGSAVYWERRYRAGGNSGVGSYGHLAQFKAEVLDAFVATHDIRTVIEFGCGDGHQLSLAHYPEYLGFDISPTAVQTCRQRFAQDGSRRFYLVAAYAGERADLVLSLDVIFHLVEDAVFDAYMRRLFQAANRYLVIYSSDAPYVSAEGPAPPHVRHRGFSGWIGANAPDWRLLEHIPNRYPYRGDYLSGTLSDFFIYQRAA